MDKLLQQAFRLYIQGETKQAASFCNKIIKGNPKAHQALHLLALINKRQNKYKLAIKTFKKAIDLAPSTPMYWNNLGETYRETDNHSEAIKCYQKAIQHKPDYPEAYCNWGVVELSMNNFSQAEQLFLDSIKINHELANTHYNLAILYTEIGQKDKAILEYNKCLSSEPDNVAAIVNLACIEIDEHRFDKANELLQKAIKLEPDNSKVHINLGRMYFNRGHCLDAISFYTNATNIDPVNFDAWLDLGRAQKKYGLHSNSIDSFKQALAIHPKSTEAILSLVDATWRYSGIDTALILAREYADIINNDAQTHELLSSIFLDEGNYAEAEAEAHLCLSKQQDNVNAYFVISQIRTITEKEYYLNKMLALFSSNELDPFKKATLGFSISRMLDATGEHDSAFNYLEHACRLQLLSYGNPTTDISSLKHKLSELKLFFTPEFIESHKNHGFTDASPIFIIGNPRSGKTLAETLLHKCTSSIPAGESVLFYEAVRTTLENQKGAKYPNGVKSLDSEKYKQIGNNYVNQLSKQFNSNASIINTLPGNMPLVGLIYLTLPNAKIIWVDRDPMDNCFDMYRKQFGHGREYSYELKTCGEYALLTNQTMQYWEQLLPGFIYKLKFEDLIADPDNQLKSLSEFCSLELHLEQLNDKAIDDIIPKPDEVTGIWKPYESYLDPLKTGLKI